MARIFTISFTHNDTSFHTMVAVKTTPFYIEYTLADLDEELALLLPGNKIISPSFRSFIFPNAQPHHSGELMGAIIKAVRIHLQAVNNPLIP
jgi:hypothetical protein